MANLLVHIADFDEADAARRFAEALPAHTVLRRHDDFDPATIDYVFVWKPTPEAFDGLSGLKAILSFGAGVDALLGHPRLPDAPIARYVEDDLTQRMSDYVLANVLMHTRLHTRFRADQQAKRWVQLYPPPSSTVTVGIMGAGVLGQDALRHLKVFGFKLRVWSRTRAQIDGVEAFAGPDELDAFLGGTDVLVNLLPLTPETRGILNYETFGKLSRDGLTDGPVVINAGRGGHQSETDLRRALTDGTLGAASLDVFEVEPLPQSSPLWELPNCVITPHIGAASDVAAYVGYFSKVVTDHEAGKPLPHVIDRQRGY